MAVTNLFSEPQIGHGDDGGSDQEFAKFIVALMDQCAKRGPLIERAMHHAIKAAGEELARLELEKKLSDRHPERLA